jgi:hypothetical protein
LSIAFGYKVATVDTAKLNRQATCASAPPQNLLQSFWGPHFPEAQIIFFGTRLRGVRGAFLRKRVQKYCFFLT